MVEADSPVIRQRELRRALPVAVLAAVLVAAGWWLGWLPALERPGWDLLLRLPRPAPGPPTRFVAVVVDDPSIEALGPLPWPRRRLADVLDAARRAGAQGLAVDVLLSEPGEPTGDLALAEALGRGPTVLAAALSPAGTWLLPLATFGGAARAAHVHAEVDRDGVVRSILATKQADGLALPALAVAAVELAGTRSPLVAGRRLRPDFRPSPAAIPTISAAALLDGTADSSLLADRVVFVGVTAAAATDQLFVPVGDRRRPQPGVLVHASIAASLARRGLLRPPPGWLVVLGALAVALGLQELRHRAGRLRRRHLLAVACLLPAVGVAAFLASGWLVPMASLAVAAGATAIVREATESRLAQRETGTILAGLLHDPSAADPPLPVGIQGRLQLARRLQAELLRDRDLRRTLLEGLTEGVVLWSPSGTPLLANRAATVLWGDALARDELETAAGAPLERAGRTLEVELTSLDAGGGLGLIRDVTDRVALERRRREMQRLVSHELKTPLASIAGFGEMLAAYQLAPDELQRVAGLIRGEAERLGEMVRAFLDLERMEAGAWRDELAELDLGALADRRCELLRPAAAARGIRLEITTTARAVVCGVPRLLEQLVDNLVGNAVKYSPDGSVVRVEVAREDGGSLLTVADDGPGIPTDSVPHLFERFYRVPGTRREGSGLGLAVVKEVADWHRATVSVDTAPGRGTRMMVRFETATEETA